MILIKVKTTTSLKTTPKKHKQNSNTSIQKLDSFFATDALNVVFNIFLTSFPIALINDCFSLLAIWKYYFCYKLFEKAIDEMRKVHVIIPISIIFFLNSMILWWISDVLILTWSYQKYIKTYMYFLTKCHNFNNML